MATGKASKKASEENNPVNTLILDLQLPEVWENRFLLVKAPSLWSFIKATLENKYNCFQNSKILKLISKMYHEE